MVTMQQMAFSAGLAEKVFCKSCYKMQVLDCMIVQQNMVTLCNGTQNYNLQHKKM